MASVHEELTRRDARKTEPASTTGPDGRGATSVVAVLFPLSPEELSGLGAEFGNHWAVVDGRRAEHADVVLFLPCSQQATAAVRRLFPTAELIVVDSAMDATTPREGWMRRLFDAGADAYACDTAVLAA